MKADAVVFEDKMKVVYREVNVPEPGPNDVVVNTRYSWISNGTEGSLLRGERKNGETPWQPGDPRPFPMAAGYQCTGVVEKVGEEVGDIRPGKWVFSALGRIEGMYEPFGGHISPKVTPRSMVWPLPDGLDPVAASGLVLTQVGYNCATRPPVKIGDVALVLGDGLVGNWTAQMLHLQGAEVILVGKHDERLAFFPQGNRRHQINFTRTDIVEAAREISPSGTDILVDTVGSLQTVLNCYSLLKHNGHIVSAGFNKNDSMLDIQRLRFGEITFHSPSGWEHRRMNETLALIAGGLIDTTSLITHRFPVEQAENAWKLINERTETVLGVILEWN